MSMIYDVYVPILPSGIWRATTVKIYGSPDPEGFAYPLLGV